MTSTEPIAIELLSPARNLECGIAAIDHGADAVYIGAERFGARSAAGNSVDDIAELCCYAHQFGARVYVTVNTIIYDDELERVQRLVWELYRAGVDALIVQDMALLEMELPPIPLHASTQMDNRSADKVEWLRSLGFRQAVLARELTLQEIAAIHRAVPQMPLEVFCHGALCVSYSGQCYASQYCFGRSANRGECAQFCRLPFTLEDAGGRVIEQGSHVLSLRDMNRSEWLEEMMDAGVRSFKIEGRLKDVSYVKNVTAWYRRLIDAILERRTDLRRSSYGREEFTFRPDPELSFSRGFTDYFLHGRKPEMSQPLTPKSRGPIVGRVKEVRRDCIVVSGTASFHNGDGLCFIGPDNQLKGFRVNRAEDNRLYINVQRVQEVQRFKAASKREESDACISFSKREQAQSNGQEGQGALPAVGTVLYRSYNHEWERMMAGRTAERRIGLRWELAETEQGFRLMVTREDGAILWHDFEAEHQAARSDQNQQITDVLNRLGDTIYRSEAVRVDFSQPWFIPRSQLALWRRQLLDELSERPLPSSISRQPDPAGDKAQDDDAAPVDGKAFRVPDHCTYRSNVGNRLARQFYEQQGAESVDAAMEVDPGPFRRDGVEVMTCRFCLKYERGWCPRLHPHEPVPPEPYTLVAPGGQRFQLLFDCRRCEMKVMG